MKMTFRGWSQERVNPHVRVVSPVSVGRSLKEGSPMKWRGPLSARGRVNNLGLNGDFQVDFEFTATELKNWLTAYVEAEPEKALALISGVQLAAFRKLVRQAKKGA